MSVSKSLTLAIVLILELNQHGDPVYTFNPIAVVPRRPA
jgi:hypothetical protein